MKSRKRKEQHKGKEKTNEVMLSWKKEYFYCFSILVEVVFKKHHAIFPLLFLRYEKTSCKAANWLKWKHPSLEQELVNKRKFGHKSDILYFSDSSVNNRLSQKVLEKTFQFWTHFLKDTSFNFFGLWIVALDKGV